MEKDIPNMETGTDEALSTLPVLGLEWNGGNVRDNWCIVNNVFLSLQPR